MRTKEQFRDSFESRIAQTRLGPVEYSIIGEGPAVLVIHGCPGGYDQGLIAAKLASNEGFQFVALSRPGYLRTPLTVGDTPTAQADAYAALLDALGIQSAAVIGISGGGPSALQFALRHPSRCWGLVTLCAIGRRLTDAEIMKCKSVKRRISFALSLIAQVAGHVVSEFYHRVRKLLSALARPSLHLKRRASQRNENLQVILGLLRNFRMMSLRKAGLKNDMEQLVNLPLYPLHEVAVPALVVHGKADELVPFSHAEFIAHRIPDAKLVGIENGGHLFITTHKQSVIPAIFAFLKESIGLARQTSVGSAA